MGARRTATADSRSKPSGPARIPDSKNPAHVHFTAFLPSGERYHAGEVQFANDPCISQSARDAGARDEFEEVRPVRREGDVEHVTFALRLEPAASSNRVNAVAIVRPLMVKEGTMRDNPDRRTFIALTAAAIAAVPLAFTSDEAHAQDREYIAALERAQRDRPKTLSSSERIAPTSEPGPPLIVRGRAVAEDGATPVAGAVSLRLPHRPKRSV